MGLLKWLTGAADRSAKSSKRGGGQQKKKKKKEEPKRQREPSRESQPKPSGGKQTPRSGGSKQTSQAKSSTFQPKTFQPKTFKPSATQTQSRYKSFQASNVTPRGYKASTAAKPKAKAEAKVKGAVTKATAGQTKRSEAHSIFEKPKNYDYKKDLQQAYKKGSQTTTLGTKQKKTTTKVGKTNLESVNALTRSEMSRVEVASRYGKKKGNVLLKGGKRTGQKDIREKVGSKTAESAYKSKAATGVMQGMSKVDIFSNSVGTYNKAAKKTAVILRALTQARSTSF